MIRGPYFLERVAVMMGVAADMGYPPDADNLKTCWPELSDREIDHLLAEWASR